MGRYWLPGNAGSEQPGNMLFMHCLPAESVLSPETKGNHFLKLGMASFEAFRVDDGSITRFQRTSRRLAMSFWDDLVVRLRKREPLWCFGYRIGHQLTWLGFWDMVDNGTFQIRSLVDDDPPVIIRGSMNGCNVVFVDVRNYFRCHLSELVVRAGLALDPVDPNCEHTEHAIEWSFNVIVAISRNILSLMNLVKCHDLGTWKTTAPAQAFQAYRHRLHEKMGYVKSTITNGVETKREDITVIPPLIHRVNAVIDMEREASYAGRT